MRHSCVNESSTPSHTARPPGVTPQLPPLIVKMPRILVVENEAAIAELIALNLRNAGFSVVLAANAIQAQRAATAMLPSVALLDWTLPGQSGVSLARQWRSELRTRELPMIMLTGRSAERDVVEALDAGVDDHLAKPFSTKELLARIYALLRRRAPELLDTPVTIGPLSIYPVTRQVRAHGISKKLHLTEFKLLHYLMAYPHRVHERKTLLDRIWGDHVFIEERTVDVHVKRLRIALVSLRCDSMVQTVRGSGYRMAEMEPAREPETA